MIMFSPAEAPMAPPRVESELQQINAACLRVGVGAVFVYAVAVAATLFAFNGQREYLLGAMRGAAGLAASALTASLLLRGITWLTNDGGAVVPGRRVEARAGDAGRRLAGALREPGGRVHVVALLFSPSARGLGPHHALPRAHAALVRVDRAQLRDDVYDRGGGPEQPVVGGAPGGDGGLVDVVRLPAAAGARAARVGRAHDPELRLVRGPLPAPLAEARLVRRGAETARSGARHAPPRRRSRRGVARGNVLRFTDVLLHHLDDVCHYLLFRECCKVDGVGLARSAGVAVRLRRRRGLTVEAPLRGRHRRRAFGVVRRGRRRGTEAPRAPRFGGCRLGRVVGHTSSLGEASPRRRPRASGYGGLAESGCVARRAKGAVRDGTETKMARRLGRHPRDDHHL
mmetsp:Transcript_27517/g.98208  ORF Transcript_27517/g.98208 Transcript_27517/m.98208 type:complete len:400 (+) Transcript_27517:225-1424(+)